MKPLGLNEIREKYLSFFESKGHLRLPSFSLVPKNDPSLLLINSGMAPLKPYFTGKEVPPRRRITTCQRCIRTPDIENVGKTVRHGTFFEMLGNFSFGDYFKREATAWAWEFVTEILKLPKERLWVSIYEEDDEAFEIWTKEVGVSADRIVRMGKEDNFWEIGTGPCGPCSEIYFDRGPDKGCGRIDCSIDCDCDRFIEFWNLVFTQFDKDEHGNYHRLPNPNIDTGMGLERIAAIMQGVDSLFEVDTIRSILDYTAQIAGKEYGKDYKTDVSLRIITDHIRGITFMISDGILPSNEGRGYVLRRLLRRAARQGRLIGLKEPFLYKIADAVIAASKEAYPELTEREEYIKKVIRIEEEKFSETIEQGLIILNEFITELKSNNQKVLPGEKAFRLYDTYGFPPDLTKEILEEHDISLDEEGFAKNMQEQKEQGRASWHGAGEVGWDINGFEDLDINIVSEFTGYTSVREEAIVLAIIKNQNIVKHCVKGDEVGLILEKTPFYGESGGQVGDTGIIFNKDVRIKVKDTKKIGEKRILHLGVVEKGSLLVGDKVVAEIDVGRRRAIERNHSATHLLHRALKDVLGEHVSQAGSLVEPERLRFDFTHFSPLNSEELAEIEKRINDRILQGLNVTIEEMVLEEARKLGAVALFDEKYGDKVRLVNIGNYSLELCGGCHVDNTSKIGLFKILSESGISAGVRRIEAITGYASLEYLKDLENKMESIAKILKTTPQDCIKKAETLVNDIKGLTRENEMLRNKIIGQASDEILSKAIEVEGVKVITARLDQLSPEELRNMGDRLKTKLNTGIVILASSKDDKVNLVGMATKSAVEKGIHVGNILKEISKIVDGGGGGRPDMAQAGGKDTTRIDEALNKAEKMIQELLRR